jgi:hypothetical protein
MAKAENLTMIERHVEKMVLAACLLALGLASWHWLFSSPTKLQIFSPSQGKMVPVSPTEADAKLQAAAETVRKTYSDSGYAKKIPPVPAWVGRLNDIRGMSLLPPAPVDLAVPRMPIASVEPNTPQDDISIKKLIAAMDAPAKPVMMGSIELPKRSPLADVVLARGLSGYPLEDLAAKWKEILKDDVPFQVRPYKLIVEVQQAPGDGDWSKAKAVIVQTEPLDAAGKPIAPPEIPDFDGKNVAEVRKARDTVAVPAMQQQILQPHYLPVWRAVQKQWVQPELPGQTVQAVPAAMFVQPVQPVQPGQAIIAFFDDSTMTIGPSYRYRVQLVVVNPLLTYDEAVAKDRQAEARQKFLTSKPSEWSDPVSVNREVYFFLTGANPLANRMTATVYARQWGQWVSRNFDVQVGEFIGGAEKIDLLDPMGKGKKSADVDFSTGCVAVWLDFKKPLFKPGFSFTTTTSELLYLDAKGQLQSRLKTWDDGSDRRKALEEAVRSAAKE